MSEQRGKTVCEVITTQDIISLKNDSTLKDKAFAMMVYANTKIFVVYKK